jgi:hypothetical protein
MEERLPGTPHLEKDTEDILRGSEKPLSDHPGTAHANIVLGLKAPTELFPKIGQWLKML